MVFVCVCVFSLWVDLKLFRKHIYFGLEFLFLGSKFGLQDYIFLSLHILMCNDHWLFLSPSLEIALAHVTHVANMGSCCYITFIIIIDMTVYNLTYQYHFLRIHLRDILSVYTTEYFLRILFYLSPVSLRLFPP